MAADALAWGVEPAPSLAPARAAAMPPEMRFRSAPVCVSVVMALLSVCGAVDPLPVADVEVDVLASFAVEIRSLLRVVMDPVPLKTSATALVWYFERKGWFFRTWVLLLVTVLVAVLGDTGW